MHQGKRGWEACKSWRMGGAFRNVIYRNSWLTAAVVTGTRPAQDPQLRFQCRKRRNLLLAEMLLAVDGSWGQERVTFIFGVALGWLLLAQWIASHLRKHAHMVALVGPSGS